ncbi:MAG: hypothetical protein GY898_24435 [Proteobacteria bacterium]|nr:hypothetical protein [Pseudomonadota bacterium]
MESLRTSLLAAFAAFALTACPPPVDDDDDLVAPPDDDDGADCDADTDCSFTVGLEICGDEGVCVEGDRNNSIDEAQLMEYDTSTQLYIAPAGDVDYYRFTGTQGDLFLVSTLATDPETLDTVVIYYDEDGTELAFNDDFERVTSVPPDSRLYSGVPATGTFFFSVQDRRSWANDPTDPAVGGDDSQYTVTLGRAPGDTAIVVASEDNDEPASATIWDVANTLTNYTVGGTLEPTGDHDWLRVPVEAGQALRVYGFPNGGSLGTTEVSVYLPDGETLISTHEALAWDTEHRAFIPVLEDGDYYLDVSEADGRGGFGYWYFLHAAKNKAEDGFPPEVEPNNSSEEAEPLTGDDTLWGRIHPAGDEDWYAFTAEAGERLTLRFTRTQHLESTALTVTLYDPAGDVADAGSWNGEEDNVFELLELEAGGHQIQVVEQNPDAGDRANRFYEMEVVIQ